MKKVDNPKKRKTPAHSDRVRAHGIIDMGAEMVNVEFLIQSCAREDRLRDALQHAIDMLETADGHEGNTLNLKRLLKDLE